VKNPREYLAGINRVFRAVAVRSFPETGCARLQGEAWVDWLRSLLPEQDGTGELGVLASGPYEPTPEFEAASLRELAVAWVKLYG